MPGFSVGDLATAARRRFALYSCGHARRYACSRMPVVVLGDHILKTAFALLVLALMLVSGTGGWCFTRIRRPEAAGGLHQVLVSGRLEGPCGYAVAGVDLNFSGGCHERALALALLALTLASAVTATVSPTLAGPKQCVGCK